LRQLTHTHQFSTFPSFFFFYYFRCPKCHERFSQFDHRDSHTKKCTGFKMPQLPITDVKNPICSTREEVYKLTTAGERCQGIGKDQNGEFPCPFELDGFVCGYKAQSRSILVIHYLTHTGETPFKYVSKLHCVSSFPDKFIFIISSSPIVSFPYPQSTFRINFTALYHNESKYTQRSINWAF
jgi:uncharacterized Zn-finger protein